MAINPAASLSTPILTYASPAQKKAVGMENEEDKPRPLPPVEQSDKSESTANRKRDPNRIEDELPERHPPPQYQQQPDERADEEQSISPTFDLTQDTPYEDYPERAQFIDDLLFVAGKGLSCKDSDGVK